MWFIFIWLSGVVVVLGLCYKEAMDAPAGRLTTGDIIPVLVGSCYSWWIVILLIRSKFGEDNS